MAAVGVGTKYHCAINGQGYIVGERGYSRKDAPVFTPRFGTGEQGINDLDVFKIFSQDDFSGGMFQRHFDDITKTARVDGMLLNPYDKLLYNAPPHSQTSPISGWRGTVNAHTVYKGVLYFAANGAGSHTGTVYRYNPSTKDYTSIKTDFATAVSAMAVVNDKLFVATTGGLYWGWDGTTWTSQGSFGVILIQPFNGKMYCNGNGSTDKGRLFSHDGTPGTGVAGALYPVGDVNVAFNSMAVFNSRLYIGKPDGLFAYDGTRVVNILDYQQNYDARNFQFMATHEGFLYYTIKDKVYRFNGATVEQVRDFAQYETIVDVQSAGGRLWVTTQVANVYVNDKITANTGYLYYFDGVGWWNYGALTLTDGGTGTYNALGISYISDGTYRHLLYGLVHGNAAAPDNSHYVYNLAEEYVASASSSGTDGYVITSEFDAGFPDVDKYYDGIQINFENLTAASDFITVEIRTYDGKTWGSYQTLGTLDKNYTSNYLKRSDTSLSGTFRKIQISIHVYKFAANSSALLALRSFALKYYLNPVQTWQWQLKLLCYGTGDVPLQLADNTAETTMPATLRDNIYTARQSASPIAFEDIDFNLLNGAINNSVTTITVDSTKGFRSSGYIKIDDEIIKYTGKTTTTFTGCTRAALSTSAASHSDNTVVNAYFRVVIKSIDQESVIAPNQETTGQESEITLVLGEVPFSA